MITIVIPTFRRPDFIIRTLDYYAAAGFRGDLLVGDSSEGEAARRARVAVGRLASQLKISYVDCRGLDDRLTLHRLSTMIESPYTAYIGDDDILVPEGLDRCVRFLEENPGYVAANGRAWTFDVRPGPAYGRLRVFAGYRQPELLQDRARDRLEGLLRDYRVALFSVHRTPAWREMWQHTPAVPDRAFAAELLPACLSSVLGKIRHLDCFYLLRQGNNAAQYKLPQLADWMSTPAWRESMTAFCRRVAETVQRIDGGDAACSPEQVEALLSRWYLPRLDASRRQRTLELQAPRGAVRRFLRAIPGLRRLVQTAVRWIWLIRSGGGPFSLDAMQFRGLVLLDRATGARSFWPQFAVVRRTIGRPAPADGSGLAT